MQLGELVSPEILFAEPTPEDLLNRAIALLEPEEERERTSLYDFVQLFWSVLEPSRPFIPNWHIEVMCEHLEAISRREIFKLIINVPPGASKSILVNAFWPAWEWAEINPSLRYLCTSYARQLVLRDSRKCRAIIRSPLYQQMYGHLFMMDPRQDNVIKFANNHTGFRLCSTVGGLGTGERADRILCDDPYKVSNSESDTIRTTTNEWWSQEMSSRNADPYSAWLVIMQRVHGNDLSDICKELGYESLIIPMEYEGNKQISTCLDIEDPRTEDRELMFPERFDETFCKDMLITLRAYGFAAQMQQRPVPKEGGIINESWFNYTKYLPDEVDYILISVDTANKDKDINAYNAIGVFLVDENRIIVAEVYREHLNQPDLKRRVKEIASVWHPNVLVIEDAASGTGLIQFLQEETTLPIFPNKPKGSKRSRLENESPTVQAGNVYLWEGQDWVHEFKKEICTAPFGKYWDQCDMFSQGLKYLREQRSTKTGMQLLSGG